MGQKKSAPPKASSKSPGGTSCTYDGKSYSGGSNIKMPGAGGKDVVKFCDPKTGNWMTVS